MMTQSNTPELAQILRTQQEVILNEWETRVRTKIEAARTQGHTALRDHLPLFLRNLSDVLDPRKSKDAADVAGTAGETHGKERADLLRYTLPQVLYEYNILRQVVFEVFEGKGPIGQVERDVVLKSFDLAAQDAAEAFMDVRTEQERQKRRRVEFERDQTRKELHRLEADSHLQKTFVATLSHDLRNPIGTVRMALDMLLLEVPLTEEVNNLSEMMSRNLRRAENMLLDLLDVNRIKSGYTLPLNIEACDLSHLAKIALTDMYASRDQGFLLKAHEEIRGFWDPLRLHRIIENLLDNAVKYGTINGPIVMTLEQNLEHTTIAVHNEGAPIPLAEQAFIFEPNNQATRSEEGRPAKGWGLGLSLVKAVAEAHGGSVRVESASEIGTTFVVTLPNDSRPRKS